MPCVQPKTPPDFLRDSGKPIMHHWEIGSTINIGWPDYNVSERPYTIVEFDSFGPVFRARVSDATADGRQGGFLVVFGCPDVVLDMLAEQATEKLGFQVVVSDLRCSIEGNTLHSFDYEWYPTPEFAERPGDLARTIADSLEEMRCSG